MSSWSATLDPEQRARCIAIIRAHGGRPSHHHHLGGGHNPGDGWSVFMEPTTVRPYYLELRWREAGVIRQRIVITNEPPHPKGPPSRSAPLVTARSQEDTPAAAGSNAQELEDAPR